MFIQTCYLTNNAIRQTLEKYRYVISFFLRENMFNMFVGMVKIKKKPFNMVLFNEDRRK